MTHPAGSTGHGSSAHRGWTGQSLADQPTTQVPLDGFDSLFGTAYEPPHEPPYETRYGSPYDDAYDRPASGEPVYGGATDDGPTYDLGDDLEDDLGDDDAPDWAGAHQGGAPAAVRRADPLAGLLLLLAGMAAGVSLLVVWVNGGATGLELVRDGIGEVRSGAPSGAWWQPPVVVGSGIALFVLGLLMYAPARTHRFLGVLALLVSLLAAAGVLVPLADAHWEPAPFAVGASFAVAVGALGVLGALKALSTGPRWTSRP